MKKNKLLIGPDQYEYQREMERNYNEFSSKIDPLIFCEKVTNFLCDYDSPLKEDESPSKYLPPNYIRNSTVKKESSNEIVQVDDDQDDVIVVNGNSKLTNGHNDEKVS